MPIKDPERRKSADRERKRRSRHRALVTVVGTGGADSAGADAGEDTDHIRPGLPDAKHATGVGVRPLEAQGGAETENVLPSPPDLATVEGISAALARAMGGLHRYEGLLDAVAVAKATSSLAGVAVRLLEVTDLERRLVTLEARLIDEGRRGR